MARIRLPRLPAPNVCHNVIGPGGQHSTQTLGDLGNALLSFAPHVEGPHDSRRVMFAPGDGSLPWDCTVERIHQHPAHWGDHGNPNLTVWGSFIGGVYRAVLKDGKWTFYEYRGVQDRGYFRGFSEAARKRLPLGDN